MDEQNWAIAPSQPALRADEVEEAREQIEVVVIWGTQALHVTHLEAKGRFVIGEGSSNFSVGAEVLGAAQHVVIEGGVLQIPSGADGSLFVDGNEEPLRDLALVAGVEATLGLGELQLVVRTVRAGKRFAPRSAGMERGPFLCVGGTMLVTGLMLVLFSLLPPSGAALSGDRIDATSRLASYLIEAEALVEPEEVRIETEGEASPGEGEAHADDAGAMGDESAGPADRRYAIEGTARPEDREMAAQRARESAASAGILGVLQEMRGSFASPTSPFGAEHALGSDAISALGNLMGTVVGESFGYGGLSLSGTGRGAGGNAEAALGFSGVGYGASCDAECSAGLLGHGGSIGRNGIGLAARESRVPTLCASGCGSSTISGALSRETIQRVVRRHHNEVKFCFERALQSRPDLEGRVSVRFVIAPSGGVQVAVVEDTTLGDRGAEQCVTRAVRRFVFPSPDNGGVVSVTYPFVFSTR